jgi:excisionase family DNA binding protein
MPGPTDSKDALTDRTAALLADGFDTPKSAAAFLKVSVAQVYRLMQVGKLPFTRIGRSRRIPRRALIELAARNLVYGTDA